MVLLTTTPQILEILSNLPAASLSSLARTTPPIRNSTTTPTPTTLNTDTKQTPQSEHLPLPTNLSSPISHTTLIALSRLRPNGTTTPPTLNTLLRGTEPYIAPPPPKPAPSAEYIALMARLRLEQEQRDYAALTTKQNQHLSLASTGGMQDAESGDEDSINPSLVFNILLSVVMCAVAVFQLTKWWPNDGVRVLLSLGTGLVVGVAEVGVYSIFVMKKKRGREKEAALKERKVDLGEWNLQGSEDGGQESVKLRSVGEKEEIWGRGVNGGMRRRVREKWEREREQKQGDGEVKS